MAKPQSGCSLLLVLLIVVLTLGTERNATNVCNGDPLLRLFGNIKLNSYETIVSLYINGDKNRLVAKWNKEHNSTSQEYTTKLYLDEHGNLSILDVNPSDNGLYTLTHQVFNNTWTEEVEVNVLVPPSAKCKPKIEQLDGILSASLEDVICGKPKATVYWLEYYGVYRISENEIKLEPGREAGTYYACIKGLSVSCARRLNPFLDYCFPFRIEESSGGNKSKADLQPIILAVLILWPMLLHAVAVLLYYMWKKKWKQMYCPKQKCAQDTTKQSAKETNTASDGEQGQLLRNRTA